LFTAVDSASVKHFMYVLTDVCSFFISAVGTELSSQLCALSSVSYCTNYVFFSTPAWS